MFCDGPVDGKTNLNVVVRYVFLLGRLYTVFMDLYPKVTDCFCFDSSMYTMTSMVTSVTFK